MAIIASDFIKYFDLKPIKSNNNVSIYLYYEKKVNNFQQSINKNFFVDGTEK